MAETLTFALIPDAGTRVRFDALEVAVVEMRGLIQHVDRLVFRSEGIAGSRPWYVSRLASSNPTIALEAGACDSLRSHRTDQAIYDGIRGIVETDADAPPPFFSEPELERLVTIRRRVLAKGIQQIDIATESREGPVPIAPVIEERVNRILRRSIEALGSLDGELDAVNTRKRPFFTMWEVMSAQAVRVEFDPERLDEIKALLHKRVRVSGLIRYFSDGRPRSVSRLERIKDISRLPGHSDRDYWRSVPELAARHDTVQQLHEGFGG